MEFQVLLRQLRRLPSTKVQGWEVGSPKLKSSKLMLVLATSLEKGKKLVGAVIREVNGIELKFYSGRLMAS
jgi:hypothetical protein